MTSCTFAFLICLVYFVVVCWITCKTGSLGDSATVCWCRQLIQHCGVFSPYLPTGCLLLVISQKRLDLVRESLGIYWPCPSHYKHLSLRMLLTDRGTCTQYAIAIKPYFCQHFCFLSADTRRWWKTWVTTLQMASVHIMTCSSPSCKSFRIQYMDGNT